jgi:transcriptional regulator GlxA family with amidase domain
MSTDESLLMGRTEGTLATLGADRARHAARREWDRGHAEQVTLSAAAFLQPSRDALRDNPGPRHLGLPQDVLRRAQRYVNGNLDTKLTWEEIAAALGMDPFKLGRGFKLSTGMTLHQYVTRCRVRHAMNLLAQGKLSIADIALEVGFSCQSHLTTLFHKHAGTTPGAFRKAASRGARLLEPAVPEGLAPGPPLERLRA